MNLRRLNASERTKTYTKFGMILFLVFVLVLYIPTLTTLQYTSKYHIQLENRTCEEIYNKTIEGQLFSDDKNKLYKSESIVIYYMENCYNGTDIEVQQMQ